jgi:hypothetical protein
MTKTVIRGLVKKLGGPEVIAEALSHAAGREIGVSSVAMWAMRESIPWRWRPALAQLARLKGVELSEAEEDALTVPQVTAGEGKVA